MTGLFRWKAGILLAQDLGNACTHFLLHRFMRANLAHAKLFLHGILPGGYLSAHAAALRIYNTYDLILKHDQIFCNYSVSSIFYCTTHGLRAQGLVLHLPA